MIETITVRKQGRLGHLIPLWCDGRYPEVNDINLRLRPKTMLSLNLAIFLWVSWGKHLQRGNCSFYMILPSTFASDFFGGFLMCFPCIPTTSRSIPLTCCVSGLRTNISETMSRFGSWKQAAWLREESNAFLFISHEMMDDSGCFWMNSNCECVVFSLSKGPCPTHIPSMFVMHEQCSSASKTCLEISGQDVVESVERIPLTAVELNHYLVWKPSWWVLMGWPCKSPEMTSRAEWNNIEKSWTNQS